ncbi:hypothetical protein KZ483_08625 [Paenibacillus sp. sptzw28]|uniref:hypothetical protein n=1 Tax=Paenibacillus sp. sptzw28 TaxID=715179 RepID=UPI001C6DF189|nr:hypothetical protein [Paenibacillus sp. sptzw28]QYR22976.1 hypothetical protein KZ483_08625 [Paenibacillus sp. sptzw28]
MSKMLLLCVFLSSILSACSQDDNEFESETLYHYSGEMLSLVDQSKSDYSKELGILYTLMLLDFRPQEPVFEKFIDSYSGSSERNGHIVITERTKIYIPKDTNLKTLISASELGKHVKPTGAGDYPKLEFWVTPYKESDYEVEAVEINLLL